MSDARLFYKETCRPCRLLSRLAVIFSLGTIRRVPLGSAEAAAFYDRHPQWRGQLLLIDGDTVRAGTQVLRAAPLTVLRNFLHKRKEQA